MKEFVNRFRNKEDPKHTIKKIDHFTSFWIFAKQFHFGVADRVEALDRLSYSDAANSTALASQINPDFA